MSEAKIRLIVSSDGAARHGTARAWLAALPRDAEALVIAPTGHAADDLVRFETAAAGTRFGVARFTPDRLAARLAAPALAARGLVPATTLALTAVIARVVHELVDRGALERFAPVARRPGFAVTAARTIEELRMNDMDEARLRGQGGPGADLAAIAGAAARALEAAGLADRAAVYEAAIAAVEGDDPAHANAPAPLGSPLLLLDLPVTAGREAALLGALARRALRVLATAPAGDARAVAMIERALGATPDREAPADGNALAALKSCLFEERSGRTTPDGDVTLTSWPGEARECIEIARRILTEAEAGVAFDRMAVMLRSPSEYRPHLEEALRRAAVPVFFARGARQPDPAGRALLALLSCRVEGLSARRFAEYLSLAQVPDPGADGEETCWRRPDHELVPGPAADAIATDGAERDDAFEPPLPDDPAAAAVLDGTLRAPWRWERLLVDAAVIGGRDRWVRRLDGLERELALRARSLEHDDDEARREYVARQRRDLAHLRDFALPVIERLEALPDRALWSEWLARLRDLAHATLRHPGVVLETLAELEPMGPVGPVDLDEVRLVLGPRLREIALPPRASRYGAVFVGPCGSARGMAFDVVFVPGLAERLFPRKVVEDPLLPDARRREVDAGLATQAERVAAERLALRLAAGAARSRVHLSYPRLDVEQGRPRVPSFYGLEALRAIEGTVPGFDELGRRAESDATARLGWPAPENPAEAIDDAEYDLAVLARLRGADDADHEGAAHYLVTANPHLTRALYFRAHRWTKRWSYADGLVDPGEAGREVLARHHLSARAYSPTGLQNFADCPYRFFLQAIQRLQPREEPEAIESLDPLTRGGLFHEAQFDTLTTLRAKKLLPVTPARLERAGAVLDAALDAVAARYAERLCPAIPRVWEDGIASIRTDLREWLRRASEATDGWVPDRFELSFGIVDRDRPQADPASVPDPVPIPGVNLRGSIDLVERNADGRLRITDHKTGKVRADQGFAVGGGKLLQPLLYAEACEMLLDAPVHSGRLYYCTADGGFTEREVTLDDDNREAVGQALACIAEAVDDAFLPALPLKENAWDACQWCDYRSVCGPHEVNRTRRKDTKRTGAVRELRKMR